MGIIEATKSRIGQRRGDVLDELVRQLGYKEVEGMLERPHRNVVCYACGRHHGLACSCTQREKWEAAINHKDPLVREAAMRFGVPTGLLDLSGGMDARGAAAAEMAKYRGKGPVKKLIAKKCVECGKDWVGRGSYCWACQKRRQRK